MQRRVLGGAVLLLFCFAVTSHGQQLEIPRQHDRPPGPPTSAAEAVKKMTVPQGFSVEIVAEEPAVVNPVAMAIDERGRFWITESLEYPRREPGPGRDRVKVLEDTTGDGKADRVTVFAEGLNIPSGIAVGYGGVWVANAPDLLFMQDTDGDGRADRQEVIVTGFGRTDTHELPNSLTWGPDGWLYGLNGVFNYCEVQYAKTNPNYSPEHPGWKFTCALFRVHPRTKEFQIFAEGTSNPWGIAINQTGEFFLSACVIDHLWHIAESGYYIRQGGPYPPYTWPMRSIVDHKHQKAAYCGITWFDSDAYPEEYRRVLYMGNIHGGCINADRIAPVGSTFRGEPHPGFPGKPGAWEADKFGTLRKEGTPEKTILKDLLTANDPWFMPVVQKTGPDGCLYILDWYDRYHCYQDANADPAGIERERGRLYRLVYQGHENKLAPNLGELSDEKLIELLQARNVYQRETAQRLLAERATPTAAGQLGKVVLNESLHAEYRLLAWQTLAAMGAAHDTLLEQVLQQSDEHLRAFAVRIAGDAAMVSPAVAERIRMLARDPSPVVQRQVVVAARKRPEIDPLPVMLEVLASCGDDPLLPHIVWQNLHPLLETRSADFLKLVKQYDLKQTPNLTQLMPRVTERILNKKSGE